MKFISFPNQNSDGNVRMAMEFCCNLLKYGNNNNKKYFRYHSNTHKKNKSKCNGRIISKILSEFQWAKADELAYFSYLDGYLSMMNRWT